MAIAAITSGAYNVELEGPPGGWAEVYSEGSSWCSATRTLLGFKACARGPCGFGEPPPAVLALALGLADLRWSCF